MHRFCVNGPLEQGAVVEFPAEEAAHAARVLRLSPGDGVEVSDGEARRFSAVLERADKSCVSARLGEELPAHEAPVRVTLYQGFPKADKLDFVVQKATELGAARIVPVVMNRCVARPEGKGKKQERLLRIALEATKQCGRARVPEVTGAMSFKEALLDMVARELMLIPWEEARDVNLAAVHGAHPEARDIGLLIGPEGGISPEEARAVCEAAGGIPLTLGGRILRTETAAVAALAVTMSLWGDL